MNLYRKMALTAIVPMLLFNVSALTPAFGYTHEKNVNVQILAINDFHGQITEGRYVTGRPVGSAPVLASYLKDAAAGMEDRTFYVHAGDFVGASPPESALLQDEPSIMFFNALSNAWCDEDHRMHPKCNMVGTVGNHELDEGKDEMLRLFYGGNYEDGPFLQDPWKGADFPHVCSNIVYEDTGRPFIPPYVIKRVKGIPIAFIGAILKGAESIVTASGIEGLEFVDEAEAINKQVQELKCSGVKAVVVILHQGGSQASYSGPTDPEKGDVSGEIVDIVTALDSEVDVVICGHSHGFTNAMLKNAEGANILLTQAWSKGTAYSDIDLVINRHSRDVEYKSAEIVTTWADDGPGLDPDPEIEALVEKAKEATESLTGKLIAEAATDILKAQNNAGESALGNLIADAQRNKMQSDFAFMNPGGIRADLTEGEITWGDLYTVQPFNNYLIKLALTGQQVYDLLNQQYTPYQPYDRILQVSGLTYTFDASRADNDLVVEVRKDGEPIDLSATYTVTVNSFIAEGGDLFTVLPEGTVLEVGPIDLDALIEFIEGLPQPVTYAIEGRIERLN